MQNETMEIKIRNRLSELELALKELQSVNVDVLTEEGFESIGELEYCIFEFKSLLDIEGEREETYIKQRAD
jgi:hypothetical protein